MKTLRLVGMVLLCLALLLASAGCGQKDIIPPSLPASLTQTTPCDDNTPTFTWDAARDDDSGVDYYLVVIDGGAIEVARTNRNTTTYTLVTAVSDGSHTIEVKAVDKAGNEGAAATLTFVVGAAPAVISGVESVNITVSTADIWWVTNGPATSRVDYGPSTSYGSTTQKDDSLATSHAVTLTGLFPNTLYHYRVESLDCAGHSTISEDHTFTTAKLTVEVSGPISENTTWTSDSTYIAKGNVGVAENVTLTIEPGTVVKFNPDCALQVHGSLIAVGQPGNMIVFTSASDQCQVGNPFCTWGGIQWVYRPTPHSRDIVLSYCVIELADTGLDMGSSGSDSEITHNIIRYCNYGIFWMPVFYTPASMIRQNEIYSNAVGIHTSGSLEGTDISYNAIWDNDIGLRLFGSVLVSHNTVRDNDVGIECRGPLTIQSNNIYSNRKFNLEYTYGDKPLDATMTWWGTTDESVIQQYIRDYYDDITLPVVTYKPYATAPIPDAP